MSIKITKLSENSYQYQENNGTIVNLDEKSIVLEKKTGIYWLKLPTNELNRKLVSTKKFAETNEIILEAVKTARAPQSSSKKSWKEYLTERELEDLEVAEKNYNDMLNEFKSIANARREDAKKKPLTEKEKLLAKIAKYQKALEELSDEG